MLTSAMMCYLLSYIKYCNYMKRIMIVGCPRSGTTLLQQLIGGHPDIFTTKETHYFDIMLKNSIRDALYIPPGRFRKWQDKFINNYQILMLPDSSTTPASRKEAVCEFVNIMDYNAIRNRKKCWVEKTPTHLFKIKYIERHAEDIHYIHILRNPLDTVASLICVGRKYPEEWPSFAPANRHALDLAINLVNQSLKYSLFYRNRPRHLHVCYDSLIEQPRKSISDICRFLNLTTDSDILEHMLSNVGTSATTRNDEKWKLGYGNAIIKNLPSKYSEMFSEEEKKYIESRVNQCRLQGTEELVAENYR